MASSPKCNFCDSVPVGFKRPVYLSGSTHDNWAIYSGGNLIYYCKDHFIDAEALRAICEDAEQDVPVTEQTLSIINARKERFVAKHGSERMARLTIEFSETNVFGAMARHCTDDFI